MKKAISIVFSFLLVFTMFIGAPVSQVMASKADTVSEIQQRTKQVTVVRYYGSYPPPYIFYNSGGYEGYIGLDSVTHNGSTYRAVYRGTVYDGPPYPIPPNVFLNE